MTTVVLPRAIAEALGSLPASLAAHGFLVQLFDESASFDNFEVVFSGRGLTFSVVRDRGQFHVDRTERSALEPAGLWRTFSGVQSLTAPLIGWLENESAA